MSERIRTLVVDDDPLARKRVRSLLEDDPEIELVGECANGREGVERIHADEPDLVLLDVQMPELDGLGVVKEVGAEKMPVVIFASAYAEFALRAFEAYALDYLLKPFDDERFRSALERAKEQVRLRKPELEERLGALLDFLKRPESAAYPEVLAIKSGDRYPLVKIQEIDYLEADGNYVRLHLGGAEKLINKTLTELEKKVLDPKSFVRIHRSTIVNLDRIASVEPLFHGEYSVTLRDGRQLVCSRRYRHNLRDRIYFTS